MNNISFYNIFWSSLLNNMGINMSMQLNDEYNIILTYFRINDLTNIQSMLDNEIDICLK